MQIARMLQHVVFVYLANTDVLCYSLTMICCCQVQNYIYWIISTENDHRHHHKFIKYDKRLRKESNMLGLPIKQNVCHFSVTVAITSHFLKIRQSYLLCIILKLFSKEIQCCKLEFDIFKIKKVMTENVSANFFFCRSYHYIKIVKEIVPPFFYHLYWNKRPLNQYLNVTSSIVIQ